VRSSLPGSADTYSLVAGAPPGRERVEQLATKASVPSTASLTYATMDVAHRDRDVRKGAPRAWVSSRMVAYWLENAHPLAAFFKELKLREIRPAGDCSRLIQSVAHKTRDQPGSKGSAGE